jgi:hypothetical protein
MTILKFNTGREYTENGQRIAATRLENGAIVLLDIDRHIDVMLPAGVELTQADVMLAYDRNWYIFPTEVGMSYGDYYAVLQQLREAANSL